MTCLIFHLLVESRSSRFNTFICETVTVTGATFRFNWPLRLRGDSIFNTLLILSRYFIWKMKCTKQILDVVYYLNYIKQQLELVYYCKIAKEKKKEFIDEWKLIFFKQRKNLNSQKFACSDFQAEILACHG